MEFEASKFYHVYNRGNNKQTLFYSSGNYLFFIKKMRRHLVKHCNILAYCLIPNHFHWLILVKKTSRNSKERHPLDQQIGTLLSSYTQSLNNRYNRTGSLFQQTTQSIPLTTQIQGLTCFHYIHQNPIRAHLVKEMGAWPYSSFPDYSGKRNGTLIDKDVASQKLDLAITPEKFIEQSKKAIVPNKIKKYISTPPHPAADFAVGVHGEARKMG